MRSAAAPTSWAARNSRLGGRTAVVITALGVLLDLVAGHVADSWLQPARIPIADLGVGWLMIG